MSRHRPGQAGTSRQITTRPDRAVSAGPDDDARTCWNAIMALATVAALIRSTSERP
jgi:hypothetical protein